MTEVKRDPNEHSHQCDLLKAVLKKGKSLLIFTHNNPDPDAIASAWILALICESLNIKTKIVYSGYLTRSENRKMVDLLGIPLTKYTPGTEKNYDHLAAVDTQAAATNNAFPDDISPLITFDHHTNKLPKRNFCVVNTSAGATATLILPLYLELKLPISEAVANAYCYAIIAETKDLSRGATDTDIYYYQKIFAYANPVTISKIRYARKPKEYYTVLHDALSIFLIENRVASCVLKKIPSPEYIAEIADTLLNIKGVSFVIVTAKVNKSVFVSTRTSHDDVEMEQVLNKAIDGNGSSGGHDRIAAGIYNGPPRKLVKHFKEIVAAYTVGS